MNNPIPPTPRTDFESVEINLEKLAYDTGKFADGLCSLGELIIGTTEMTFEDWNITIVGIGGLVEVLGLYASDLSERGHVIDRNLKVAKGNSHD